MSVRPPNVCCFVRMHGHMDFIASMSTRLCKWPTTWMCTAKRLLPLTIKNTSTSYNNSRIYNHKNCHLLPTFVVEMLTKLHANRIGGGAAGCQIERNRWYASWGAVLIGSPSPTSTITPTRFWPPSTTPSLSFCRPPTILTIS